MKTHSVTACPACGSETARGLLLGGDAVLRRCAACGFVHAPEYADPAEIYREGYLRGETEFGMDVFDPEYQRMLERIGNQRMALLDRTARPPGSFLDVGCGSGEVLIAAKRHGWDVQGVEPVEDSAREGVERGVSVITATLEESGLPERSWDVVAIFHVLEHMSQPVEFLRMISRWAKPGGHILVEVPNFRSFHRKHAQERWPSLRPLEHIGHFEPATLRSVMERAGLKPVRVDTPGYVGREQNLEQALLDLGRHHWLERAPMRLLSGSGASGARVPNGAGWALLLAMQRAYAAAKVGQVIFATARVA
ncbi:MAG TPA: methyltransferase domain-containing protein [Thermoleophilaceae bacterium]|nr:methyltransferase domain-containing protein [Thermoleophilaceae bacterium]